ncbi:uncharacterized protein LOC128546628 [Mercenaria mercenaria]|uniref:uncharacterized protein LOC128546628 n=1 Tax=Mercenaria mercenaria TaxID=6596 RepID=UPI00234F44BB|nr:uncharacterized protein LOC128546628 [Mercenaria mercenaria]
MAALNCVWDIFEKYGYSRLSADKRVEIYKNCNEIGSLFYRQKSNEDIDLVIAGSRGEGIGLHFDCDIDRLFIQRSAMGFHSYPVTSDRKRFDAEFELDFDHAPSGYCQLRLMSIQEKIDPDSRNASFLQNIENSLNEQNGHKYLRNDRMLTSAMSHLKQEGWLERSFVYDVAKGPAQPYECKLPYTKFSLNFDDVLALQCSYPSIVNEWCDRQRHHGWPSSDVIEEVRRLDVLAVPVGETEDDVMQRRISLVLGELALVRSFNDTQLKVYGALKMLAKAVLKKSSENLSSYVMKKCYILDIREYRHSQF